jgi:hypothetical protein
MGFLEREMSGIGHGAVDKSDMTADVQLTQASSNTPTSVMAERLLNPWIAGDRGRLEAEMGKWREGIFTLQPAGSQDDGRAELLLCLVQQMINEPDLFAPRTEKMHLGVWVDLLVHLAHPEQVNRD